VGEKEKRGEEGKREMKRGGQRETKGEKKGHQREAWLTNT